MVTFQTHTLLAMNSPPSTNTSSAPRKHSAKGKPSAHGKKEREKEKERGKDVGSKRRQNRSIELAPGRMDPREAADLLIAASGKAAWLDSFAEQLDRQRNADALKRILSVWDLNQSEAARLFGVSRQALNKWFSSGVPSDRAPAIADLGAATDLLVSHLKRDRIPGVVRRKAVNLGDRSLLDLLLNSDFNSVLQACRAMFAFSEANTPDLHPAKTPGQAES